MGYRKANDVLPVELVEILQNYMEGELLYIPRKSEHKLPWGNNTDTKSTLKTRNEHIYHDYLGGMSIKQLSDKYYLIDKSIRRILREQDKSEQNQLN